MERIPQNREDVLTIYFQGAFASRTQACKYAGPKGLDIRVSDGQVEHVFNPRSPELLHNIVTYDDLSDVDYERSYNPLYWLMSLAHCGANSHNNVYGTSSMPHNVLSQTDLSGPLDVEQCLSVIEYCIGKFPEKKLVLFGCSRGASVLLIAMERLKTDQLRHIRLVIVEAPFASIPSLLFEKFPFYLASLMLSILERTTSFKRNQPSPLDAVTSLNFPVRTPLLFVTSKKDWWVPPVETGQLIEMLRVKGYLDLHHLELEHSNHFRMSLDHPDDIHSYREKLAFLYQKYL